MREIEEYEAAARQACEDMGVDPDELTHTFSLPGENPAWMGYADTLRDHDYRAGLLEAHPPRKPEPKGQTFDVALKDMRENGGTWRRKGWGLGPRWVSVLNDLSGFQTASGSSWMPGIDVIADDWIKVE